jgi:hypothetical protein
VQDDAVSNAAAATVVSLLLLLPLLPVFNLMSYLPNACNMMLSPNQVARLQWSVATFRPKMMAAYYVQQVAMH